MLVIFSIFYFNYCEGYRIATNVRSYIETSNHRTCSLMMWENLSWLILVSGYGVWEIVIVTPYFGFKEYICLPFFNDDILVYY